MSYIGKYLKQTKRLERLTPDPAEWIIAASRAADELAGMCNKLSALVETIESNLTACQQHGLKAEKLDYCVRRAEEIRTKLNEIELGSFSGIAVKSTCDQLWKNLP